MLDESGFVKVPPELAQTLGKADTGTHIWRKRGMQDEAGPWYDALHAIPDESFVSPGGVSMYVPVSRAAVHKRLKAGKLTAFTYQITGKVKTLFGERETRQTPYVYIPVSECKAWAEEILGRASKKDAGVINGDQIEGATKKDLSTDFLVKDPQDWDPKKHVHDNECEAIGVGDLPWVVRELVSQALDEVLPAELAQKLRRRKARREYLLAHEASTSDETPEESVEQKEKP